MTMVLIDEKDVRLHQNCVDYDFKAQDLKTRQQMVDSMIALMDQSRGIGLAAPQVGINQRFFVISVDGSKFPCFNPMLLEQDKASEVAEEGCLSYPLLYMKVTRPKSIKCSFYDVNEQLIERTFDGIAARCFQHELDHLNGVTFVNKVSPLVLQFAKKRRSKHRNTI